MTMRTPTPPTPSAYAEEVAALEADFITPGAGRSCRKTSAS